MSCVVSALSLRSSESTCHFKSSSRGLRSPRRCHPRWGFGVMSSGKRPTGGGFGSFVSLASAHGGVGGAEDAALPLPSAPSPSAAPDQTNDGRVWERWAALSSSPSVQRATWSELLHRGARRLLAPVDGITLGLFRIGFACVLFMQAQKWANAAELFRRSGTLLPYPMFGWVPPPSPALADLYVWSLHVLPLFIGVGIFTRLAMALEFLCFTHVFIVCETNHNNHFILFCYATAMGVFTCMDANLSLDAYLYHRRHPKAPPREIGRYNLFLWQVMLSIPYTFGAIAKINTDWLLYAQPPNEWFRRREGFPYNIPGYPWFIAWGGFLFDLLIVPLLVHPWTKYRLGFPGALMFNGMNKFMFNIGVFPISMTASLSLFVDVHHARHVCNRLCAASNVLFGSRFHVGEDLKLDGWERKPGESVHDVAMMDRNTPLGVGIKGRGRVAQGGSGGTYTLRQKLVLAFIGCYFVVHLTVPLRHLVLYPGQHPSWTEEGHLAAWHMMLRSKRGTMFYVATDTKGQKFAFTPFDDMSLTRAHTKKVVNRPHTSMMYGKYIAKVGTKLSCRPKHTPVPGAQTCECNRRMTFGVTTLKPVFSESVPDVSRPYVRVFEAAGQPLDKLQIVSCFSLNGRKSQRLFDHRVNILPWVDQYETAGVTGLGKFLFPVVEYHAEPPPDVRCSISRDRGLLQALMSNAEAKGGFEKPDGSVPFMTEAGEWINDLDDLWSRVANAGLSQRGDTSVSLVPVGLDRKGLKKLLERAGFRLNRGRGRQKVLTFEWPDGREDFAYMATRKLPLTLPEVKEL